MAQSILITIVASLVIVIIGGIHAWIAWRDSRAIQEFLHGIWNISLTEDDWTR